jgi:GDP-L-fucose synthase
MADKLSFALGGKRVFVAGHRGMVGSALVRRLGRIDCEVLTVDRAALDLKDQRAALEWFEHARPDAVFAAAALVGGILANSTRPAEFLRENLAIEANLIEAAHRAGVRKLMFFGSSCVYPRSAPQPMAEEALLTGALEGTIEWYAIAKIAGIKLCQAFRSQYGCNFISVVPSNLYGPNDNFDLASGHVLAALLAKIHMAKIAGATEVVIWGTGTPRREFLHVDDLADACIFLMERYDKAGHINIGSGEDLTITTLAELIADVVGWRGRLVYDQSKPDGTPRRLLDVSRLARLGWRARIVLEDGIRATYDWFLGAYDAPGTVPRAGATNRLTS